jgi:hypothetical protein
MSQASAPTRQRISAWSISRPKRRHRSPPSAHAGDRCATASARPDGTGP